MAKIRNLSLSDRRENLRDAQPITVPVQFSLNEIERHFTESMNSVKSQYEVADALIKSGKVDGGKTIWRSQIVLAEGLMDFYIHEMSKYCLFRMFTGQWEKSEKYANFLVPIGKIEEAIETNESKDWFFSYLNERFSRDVFISLESMRDQLNLIGIEFNSVMNKAFPREKENESVDYGKNVVRELFDRRNKIAHQNDRSHESAKQNDISEEFVVDYIAKIESIVTSIQEIAEQKG